MRTRQQQRGGENAEGDMISAARQNLKRTNVEQGGKAQKATKRAFGDITNAISNNLVIDSSKKGKSKLTGIRKKTQIPQPNRRRSNRKRSSGDSKSEDTISLTSNASSEDVAMVDAAPGSSSSSCDSSIVEIGSTEANVERNDPCPEYDYDVELGVDVFNVPDYARGIFDYLKSRENLFVVSDYMSTHVKISKSMRTILVDWMVEVQENFELNHETLYLGVKMIDIFLSRIPPIAKEDLQLVGSTALFIASKYEERMAPCSDDFLYICDDAYTRDQLLEMEKNMLQAIGFDLGMPLSYRFLRRFAKVSKVNMEVLTLARYILESSLLYYELVQTSESLVAAAAFLLALRMSKTGEWTTVQEKYTTYKLSEVEPLMWKLNAMISRPPPDNIKTILEKYSHEVFFKVAKIPALVPLSQSTDSGYTS